MLAAEKGHVPALNHFLAMGIDVNSTVNHATAARLAHSNNKHDALAVLLRHNSLFPSNFNAKETRDLVLLMEEFHQHLKVFKQSDMASRHMIRLARANPKLRHFYSTSNVSAPAAALLVKNFNLYEFLLAHNITVGPFENALDGLNEYEKFKICFIHQRHVKWQPESHLMVLEASTFVGDNFSDNMAVVRRAYSDLNAMRLIRPLLVLIAAARCFKIIFDFHSDVVQQMERSCGRTNSAFFVTRHIYVGAKGLLMEATRSEVLG
jgi:hypothetical protein